MTLELRLTPSLKLAQLQIHLSQVITLANLLSVPDEVLDVVAGTVLYNPDSIENFLQDKRKEKNKEDVSDKVQSLYSSLSACDVNKDKKNTGIIISPDMRVLEGNLKVYQVDVTPDVTYIGRKKNKPEIVFSDHLKGARSLLMMQIDSSKYPETSKLLSQLKRFDDWKKGKLRESYVVFGDKQREFFEKFDITRFHIFKQEDLANELGLSPGTISRILSNRWVEARDIDGNQKFFYVKDLFVTGANLKKYMILPEFNKILDEEFKRKKAYPDYEMQRKIPNIARRTIAKYREEANIPNFAGRDIVYKSGELKEPYRII